MSGECSKMVGPSCDSGAMRKLSGSKRSVAPDRESSGGNILIGVESSWLHDTSGRRDLDLYYARRYGLSWFVLLHCQDFFLSCDFLFSLIFVYVQNLTPKAGGTALTEAVLMRCYFILVSGVVGVYDGFDCILYPAHGTVVHRHS